MYWYMFSVLVTYRPASGFESKQDPVGHPHTEASGIVAN